MGMYSQDELDSLYGDLYDDQCGWEEHATFQPSTDTEWDNADAAQRGEEHPEVAWVLTDRDVWHPNPYYKGPPVQHPEYPDECHPPVQERSYGPHYWVDENHDEVGDIVF